MDFTSAVFIQSCISSNAYNEAVFFQMVKLKLDLYSILRAVSIKQVKMELYFCKGYYWNCIFAKS